MGARNFPASGATNTLTHGSRTHYSGLILLRILVHLLLHLFLLFNDIH
jgi:hypothetical protein